ncbi:hypothetical protein Tco_0599952 [Tanacetum coccineum]
MKIKESLNVTFDETPPPSKTSPLVDDDLDEEEAIKVTEKKNLENDIEDETLEVDMLKKSGLEESKPMKTPLSSDTKLMKDKECKSVDSTKYRGMIGTMHLGLWHPKGTGIETIVYANSDREGDYVNQKSTSGICTFVGCCLTSWFSEKQTALAISTTKVEYVNAGKACQQALWMKQALVDYDIRVNDVPIMCDNKGAINVSKNPVQHSRTKHIKIPHHFLRDNVQKGNISIEKVSSKDNIANILTKPLKHESFNYLRLGLGTMEHILEKDPKKDCGHDKRSKFLYFPSSIRLAVNIFITSNDDDDNGNDEGTSHAITPSLTAFVKSFSNDIPQDLIQTHPMLTQTWKTSIHAKPKS